MTAPKIYVPAPGRPPEWVVDLMVEGRVHKHHDGKLWFVARETSQCRQRGWWPVDGGQAIRLNEDGSLEIIDAPCEHVWQATEVLRCAKCGEECRADAILDAILDAPCEHDWRQAQHATFAIGRGSVTRRILRCEKCSQEKYEVTKDAPEPTFTKSEVVEALVEEARKSDSILTGVSGRVAAERIAEVLGVLSEYRKERCK